MHRNNVQNASEDYLHLRADNQSHKWPKLHACLASFCIFPQCGGYKLNNCGEEKM